VNFHFLNQLYKKGFVPNTLLMFISGSKSGDYQDDMNHKNYTGYFTSDNEPDGIENATHTTFPKTAGYEIKISGFFLNVLWAAFLIPSGSLSLVKYLYEVG
jgi:hypothetical protein